MAEWPYNTAVWKRLRLRKLSVDPFCYPCGLRGRVVAARAVDHVKSIREGGTVFPPLDGLMSMCTSCHSHKTNSVDRPDRNTNGRRYSGFDVEGNPIDPGDAWHGEGASKAQKQGRARPVMKTSVDLFNRHYKIGEVE